MLNIIKNILKSSFFIIPFFYSNSILAQSHKSELDHKLDKYIKAFQFSAVDRLKGSNSKIYYLGRALFAEKAISGKGNISCMSCHHPNKGTGDSLPLSIGTDGAIIARNSPPLYNKGHKEFKMFFADMRVYYVDYKKTYITPEKGLNGVNPEYADITRALSGPLAAQALFPMVDKHEMLGIQNPSKNRRYYWRVIRNRILRMPKYRNAFRSVFPRQEINIGHIATALAYFQSIGFQATNTPWDNYLRGNLSAMSDHEKRGALAFVEKGLCARCHNGKHLTNFVMHNLAVPPIGPGKNGKGDDYGRYEVFKNESFLYRFMAPPLRNLAKTAPYFHNGSMRTIMDVINHYDDPYKSLAGYTGRSILEKYQAVYKGRLKIMKDLNKKKHIISRLSPPFRRPLQMSDKDKKLIELFLTKSLTEK